jgi:hypothetical protein
MWRMGRYTSLLVIADPESARSTWGLTGWVVVLFRRGTKSCAGCYSIHSYKHNVSMLSILCYQMMIDCACFHSDGASNSGRTMAVALPPW